jgi:hypothetical protein
MASRAKTPERPGRRKSVSEKPVRIAVSVHEPGGRHLAKAAAVVLTRGREKLTLKRPEGKALYEGKVTPGTYTLSVTVAGMGPSKRNVDIPPEGKTASVYLGMRGWPEYRYGENVVPFQPHDDLLAISFEPSLVALQSMSVISNLHDHLSRLFFQSDARCIAAGVTVDIRKALLNDLKKIGFHFAR